MAATATIAKTQAAWRSAVRRRLLAWYRRNARDLPWRQTSDPYAIWVSEIMLQQTQVATVERYFPRFLAEFPTIAALAAAPEDRVLRQWEGLGYYRRARQLHAAAKIIVAEHDGKFPRDIESVRNLPGIGRYTAGAILSIAFDARQPILEANTIRLLARLRAIRGDLSTASCQSRLWQAAESLLPRRGSGTLNQALMELGSLICTPRGPKCDVCPLQSLCPTFARGLQDRIPMPRQQPVMEDVQEIAVIVSRRDGAILLRKCRLTERWAGLWDFPRFAANEKTTRVPGVDRREPPANSWKAGGSAASTPAILLDTEEVHRLAGISITNIQHFAKLRHGVTRFRITLNCFTAELAAKSSRFHRQSDLRWVSLRELENYPLSTTGRILARKIVDVGQAEQ